MFRKLWQIPFFNTPWLSNKNVIIGILLYLLLAPLSYKLLPFMGFYRSDLSMQYFYNICPALSNNASNLFQLTGSLCNNPNNTHYAYPVFIFQFFFFTKYFPNFETFYYLWTALTVLTVLAMPYIWLLQRGFKFAIICLGIALLTLLQAPIFFALERGGTDITFLISWTIAFYFGLKNRWILSGLFMAIAAFFKLYPVMAIMPILIGLYLDKNSKTNLWKCCAAIGITAIIFFSLDWHLWKIFIFEVLPVETKYHIGTNAIGHSLIGPFSKFFVYPIMLFYWLLYAKVFTLNSFSAKKFTFAGVLAMSTYFNNHSFDYNLITFFPFLYICAELYYSKESPLKGNIALMWGIIILIFTILGPSNYLWGHFKFTMRLKLLLELFAYALIPISILVSEKTISLKRSFPFFVSNIK